MLYNFHIYLSLFWISCIWIISSIYNDFWGHVAWLLAVGIILGALTITNINQAPFFWAFILPKIILCLVTNLEYMIYAKESIGFVLTPGLCYIRLDPHCWIQMIGCLTYETRFIVLTPGRYPQLRMLLPSHLGSILAEFHRFRMLLPSHLGFIRTVCILKPILVAGFIQLNLLFFKLYRWRILSATFASSVRSADEE